MFKQHFLFDDPDDEAVIWKHLPFDKFLSLLQTNSLYFCRADRFEDPYEGTISKRTLDELKRFSEELEFDNRHEIHQQLLRLLADSRKMTLVNCWHINGFESDAMWKLYSNIRNSVAVQTTVGRLKQSLEDSVDIFIGKVKYADFEVEMINGFNALGPFIYKRNSFSHENELRAVIWLPAGNADLKEGDTDKEISIVVPEHGRAVNIDIDILIENIYISPLSDTWFTAIVTDILSKYERKFNVIQSAHLIGPGYLKESSSIASDDIIRFPSSVLKAFIEKDSFRIQREEDERNRIIELQTNLIKQHIQAIDDQINNSKFKLGLKTYNGATALAKMGHSFIRSKKLKTSLIIQPEGNILLILGQFDNLMIEINTSILGDLEKKILIRDVLFFFSRTMVQPLTFICLKIESQKERIIEEELPTLNAIMQTFSKFILAIEEHGV